MDKLVVGHFSDNHGQVPYRDPNIELPDVWVCSGDFFPNSTRGVADREVAFQRSWYRNKANSLYWWSFKGNVSPAQRFMEFFGGVPVLVVHGNHDFANLVDLLQEDCYPAFEVPETGMDYEGLRWAGARHIPWIAGEWNGELRANDISRVMSDVFDTDPDVLVTHVPPHGILSNMYGCNALANCFAYRTHKIKTHMFGHVHEQGGQTTTINGVLHSNAACNLNYVIIERP